MAEDITGTQFVLIFCGFNFVTFVIAVLIVALERRWRSWRERGKR